MLAKAQKSKPYFINKKEIRSLEQSYKYVSYNLDDTSKDQTKKVHTCLHK